MRNYGCLREKVQLLKGRFFPIFYVFIWEAENKEWALAPTTLFPGCPAAEDLLQVSSASGREPLSAVPLVWVHAKLGAATPPQQAAGVPAGIRTVATNTSFSLLMVLTYLTRVRQP